MIKFFLVLFALLFSGCAAFEQPPRSDAAALQSQAQANLEKTSFTDSQSRMYQRNGASSAAAQATAATDYNVASRHAPAP